MTKASIRITIKNKAELNKNFQQFGVRLKDIVHDVMDSKFNEMVNYAKDNAIWIDRTGNARQGISSVDFSEGNVVKFYLTIGVDKGIWLEVANDGKYAILQPTMTVFEPQIWDMLEQIGIQLTQGKISTFRRYKK